VSTQFYSLTYSSSENGLLTVESTELDGFDHTILWEAAPISALPTGLRFHVKGNATDSVRNSLSWHILSARFVELICRVASLDLQVFPAPLYDSESGRQIAGYFVINPIRRLKCFDRVRSVFDDDECFPDQVIAYQMAIDSSRVPDDIGVFRVDECPDSGVIFRQTVVDELVGKNLRGIAFIRCL
jgi:Immunity protein family (Imm11)